jgi:hypothetical protein
MRMQIDNLWRTSVLWGDGGSRLEDKGRKASKLQTVI